MFSRFLSNLGYRASRQFILLLIPFIIVGAVLFYGYYQILPEPTCFDGIKNQGEENIDCGGPCIECIFKNIQDIRVSLVKFDEVSEGFYDVAAEVSNSNTVLATQEFFYEIILRDDKGVIMQRAGGKSYLYAGETAHIIEAGLTSKRKVATVEFSIVHQKTKWVRGENRQPALLAGEKIAEIIRKTDGKAVTQLRLKIFNPTLVDYRNIDVGVIILDADKNITAMNKTVVDFLASGNSVPLNFSWPGEIRINTANIIIEPRVRFVRE